MGDDGTQLLEALERAIRQGPDAFVEIGLVLHAINERRLYRALGYATFADYARQACGLSRGHAYRTIRAAQVVEILRCADCPRLPANEAQARALSALASEPQTLIDVWRRLSQATHPDSVTAAAIRREVESVRSEAIKGPSSSQTCRVRASCDAKTTDIRLTRS